MKLSIIVPVYNVEKYIDECLNSLVLESSFDYEIIIINDGSTDNSYKRIEYFLENNIHLNIKVINQLNKGLSYSRNIGLKNAIGEYVFFIDSDDWISKQCFSNLMDSIVDDDIDVIIGNYFYAKENVFLEETHDKYITEELDHSGMYFLNNLYVDKISSVVWRSIYKRNFLLKNNLFFEEGVLFEDVEWTPKVYYYAKKVKTYTKGFYFYRIREGSIMNSKYELKRFEDSLKIIKKMNYFKSSIDDENSKSVIDKIIFFLIVKSFSLYDKSLDYENLSEINYLLNDLEMHSLKSKLVKKGIKYLPFFTKKLLKFYFI